MRRVTCWLFSSLCVLALSACAPNYSPNTYSSNAVQLANRVEVGVVIGYRQVAISASGTVGAVTGGAAGGVLGAEYANSALATVAATAVGSVIGSTLDHAVGDTTGWEYIVRKPSGEMLSVTQREKTPLALAQKVLVIMGPQARVIPDYSVLPDPAPVPAAAPTPEKKPETPVKVEVVLSLPPGMAVQAANQKPPAVEVTPVTQEPSTDTPAPTPKAPEIIPGVAEVLQKLGLKPVVAGAAETQAAPTQASSPAEAQACAPDAAAPCDVAAH